jgi:hypothetical protein
LGEFVLGIIPFNLSINPDFCGGDSVDDDGIGGVGGGCVGVSFVLLPG